VGELGLWRFRGGRRGGGGVGGVGEKIGGREGDSICKVILGFTIATNCAGSRGGRSINRTLSPLPDPLAGPSGGFFTLCLCHFP